MGGSKCSAWAMSCFIQFKVEATPLIIYIYCANLFLTWSRSVYKHCSSDVLLIVIIPIHIEINAVSYAYCYTIYILVCFCTGRKLNISEPIRSENQTSDDKPVDYP